MATGTVEIRSADGPVVCAGALVQGVATCSATLALPAGAQAFVAEFRGSEALAASRSDLLTVPVRRGGSLTVRTSTTSAVVGESVTVSVSLTPTDPHPNAPTGPVVVMGAAGAPICSVASLVGGTGSCSFVAAGPPRAEQLTARLADDGTFAAAVSAALPLPIRQRVTVALTVPPVLDAGGSFASFGFQVSPADPQGPVPSGSVSLEFVSTGASGCGALLGPTGAGSCSWGTGGPPGTYRVRARYFGDVLSAPAVSDVFDLQVRQQGMLGMRLTFSRRYPTVDAEWQPSADVPANVTTTVVAGSQDVVNWNAPYAAFNPEVNSISVQLGGASGTEYGGPTTSFDGYVITGFTQDIASVSVSSTYIASSVSHSSRQIALSLNGVYFGSASVLIQITFRP